jgi:IS30 family transposase
MGKSKRKIAEELGVHRSTVYRELKRNVKKDGG